MRGQSALRLLPAMFALAVLSVALHAAQTIETTARGDARTTETGQLELQGALEGDLRGTLRVTLTMEAGRRATGYWTLTTHNESADGVRIEIGTLRGHVADGAFVKGPGDMIVALSELSLSVLDGSGEYAGITEGSGRLDVRLGRETEPFSANFALTF